MPEFEINGPTLVLYSFDKAFGSNYNIEIFLLTQIIESSENELDGSKNSFCTD